jgi:predicted nicotinamide N-methyase
MLHVPHDPLRADPRIFIRANTRLLAPPLVPEIKLYLAEESLPLWQRTEDELGEIGLPPPFWAFAWAGGQALARHVLDFPEITRGKRVVDLAAGSGIVAISAMQAGAVDALASDIDAFALAAMELNAAANGVAVSVTQADLLAAPPPTADVLLVGDMFYERELAGRGLAWLQQCRKLGMDVLVGDPGRSYFPKDKFAKVAEHSVPVTRELEDSEIKRTSVWRLRD